MIQINQDTILSECTSKRKTKGISYTKNAQELKKLLLETGAIGNLGLTQSLSTAKHGIISETNEEILRHHNMEMT